MIIKVLLVLAVGYLLGNFSTGVVLSRKTKGFDIRDYGSKSAGTTNMLKVHLVGDVLVSGSVVNGLSVCGTLCVCKTEEEALQKFKRGDILVLPKTTNALMPLIRQASGLVTELDGANSHAAIAAMALDKPAIIGAAHATDILKSGIAVKLDGVRGAIFSATSGNI